MSPNLSSGHFAKNKLLYEQVIYNTLNLVGLATTLSAAEARRYAHRLIFYYYPCRGPWTLHVCIHLRLAFCPSVSRITQKLWKNVHEIIQERWTLEN